MELINQIILLQDNKISTADNSMTYIQEEGKALLRTKFSLLFFKQDKIADSILEDIGCANLSNGKCYYQNLCEVYSIDNNQSNVKQGDIVLAGLKLEKYIVINDSSQLIKNFTISSMKITPELLFLPYMCAALAIFRDYDMEFEKNFIIILDSIVLDMLKVVLEAYEINVINICNIDDLRKLERRMTFSEDDVYFIEEKDGSEEIMSFCKKKDIVIYSSENIEVDKQACHNPEIESEARELICSPECNMEKYVKFHVHGENMQLVIEKLKVMETRSILILDW